MTTHERAEYFITQAMTLGMVLEDFTCDDLDIEWVEKQKASLLEQLSRALEK